MSHEYWSRRMFLVLLLAAILWSAGLFAAPLLFSAGKTTEGVMLRFLYSPVCHQDVDRSFSLVGYPLSVCQRCSSIYLAFTAVLAVVPLLRRSNVPTELPLHGSILFLVPMGVDYLFDIAGLWSNTMISRSITGAFAGIGLALFIVPAWMEAWKCSGKRIITNNGTYST